MSKTVVISGANRGIGLELVKVFLKNDYNVIAGVRSLETATSLTSATKGENCRILPLDVTNDGSVQEFVNKFNHCDILINNAGILNQYSAPLSETLLSEVDRMYQTNVIGSLRLTQALLTQLQNSPASIIANISSLTGSLTDNTRSGKGYGYRMSKTALNMFTRSLTVDFLNIIAVSLHPGWVSSDMGGPDAPITPQESALGLYNVIAGLTKDNRGKFYDFRGELLPW